MLMYVVTDLQSILVHIIYMHVRIVIHVVTFINTAVLLPLIHELHDNLCYIII